MTNILLLLDHVILNTIEFLSCFKKTKTKKIEHVKLPSSELVMLSIENEMLANLKEKTYLVNLYLRKSKNNKF